MDMSPRVGKNLGGFHHRLDLQLEEIQPMFYTTGKWFYPLMYVEMTEVGLEEVEMYFLLRQNTVASILRLVRYWIYV